jgi:metallo-beta-lactamase class B
VNSFRASALSAVVASLILAVAPLQCAEPAAQPAASTRDLMRSWFKAWKEPVPPRHLVANIYYVGASGVSSFLITTPDGHILLDTGFEETAPLIQRSVEQLGFRLADVKLLLSSHAHVDHTGGHALMKQLTGARILASAADARLLESGGADDFIPFDPELFGYAAVKVDQIVADREVVTLGGVSLTAQLTPGHTRGATTWTMDVSDHGGRTLHVVFYSSLTIHPDTRLLATPSYPDIVRDFEASFARLASLPCDIFFAPHGGQFAMAEKFARPDRGETENPFIDPEGWRALLANAEKNFREQLAAEKAVGGSNQ